MSLNWPASPAQLERDQTTLAGKTPPLFEPGEGPLAAAGCFVCFSRSAADRAWAAAALITPDALPETRVVRGEAAHPYEAGYLALREGRLLEEAVWTLPRRPDVLLVNATGRDHPRRAGLALHLGAVLDLPSIGVTHRPLFANGPWPDDRRGSVRPLLLDLDHVGYWVVTRAGTRPLAVDAAWRTDPDVARRLLLALCQSHRTPEPIRLARQAARQARAVDRVEDPHRA